MTAKICISFFLSSLCRYNGLKGTFYHADHAAVATMYINKGRLIAVNAYNCFNFADLLAQTAPAGPAALIINAE